MRIRILLPLFYCLVSFVFLGNAQDISTINEMADLQFKNAKYKSALDNYLKVNKEKPNDIGVKYKLGVCYLEMGQIQNAEQYLLFSANQKGGNHEAWYQLGRLNHKKSAFKDAIGYYKKYIKDSNNEENRVLAKHYIRQCAAARELKYQEELAIVDNLGSKVNGYLDDYAPMISPGRQNTIYFSSCRKGNSGDLRDLEGLEDEIIGQYNSDIFSTQLINGEWKATRPMNNLINSSKHDEVIGFSNNSTVMYYYKGYIATRDGAIYTDTLKNSEEVIFPTEFRSPIKVRNGDETPRFFNDSIIIYASRMEGGYGGLDLYVIKKLPGGFWTRPENLGPQINTPFDEKCPFLAKNGRTLYYSSNTTRSLGGFDIFRSTFRDDIYQWTLPENLGAPINSTGDDLYFTLANDGLKSFLSSNRIGGAGGFDIYVGYFKSVQTEQMRVSNPVAFNLINKENPANTGMANNTISNPAPTPVSTPLGTPQNIIFSPMFYTSDDILTKVNMVELNKLIKLASSFPLMKFELIGHTDDTDPEKFRLYFSYLRADKAADYLRNNGVKPNNIIVKGLGSNYAVSKNKNQDGSESENGKKMNRRIEIRLLNTEGTGVNSSTKWPVINERLAVYDRSTYDKSLMGLSYKVQVAALRSMYDSDVIVKYKDSMIEQDDQPSLLRYTVGLFRTYSSARQLKNDLKGQGIEQAFVVAYIDGVRIDPVMAESLKSEYPDLGNFIQGW